jgi:formamidopyrimidine-DNA glycosylase
MPELPEVETIVRRLRRKLSGRWIVGFATDRAAAVRPSLAAVRRGIVGKQIRSVRRRAKYLVLQLSPDGYLLLHLGMSGQLYWQADCPRQPPYLRSSLQFADGNRLLFCDARRFGRIIYSQKLQSAIGGLGIEPLSRQFTVGKLKELLQNRSARLKALLLDQSVIAGLGNIYVDESLHRAGLHPLTRACQLSRAQIARLHGAIRSVLREAIRYRGTTFDWVYPGGAMQQRLRVYGRAGQPCLSTRKSRRCRGTIRYLRVGQRGTYLCPVCQVQEAAF